MIEEVVLLDEDGRAIGTRAKATVHHEATPLHLAFSCYLLDADDRVLMTRRATTKRTWPGVWTNSCCGHPAPGEPLRDAVARRVREELGVGVTDLRLALPAFRYRAVMPDGTVENEMCPVLVGRCEGSGSLDPDPAEVDDARWEPWDVVRREVLAGDRDVSPWCREQFALLPASPWAGSPPAPSGLPPAVRL